jgi:tetratricopeptide (TPR) repeat protein
MPSRLEVLELLASRGNDPFPIYGLALEYKSAGRIDDAVRTFESLRERFPAYVPQYLMAGQILVTAGRAAEARAWLERGLEVARTAGDAHARSELQSALEGLP